MTNCYAQVEPSGRIIIRRQAQSVAMTIATGPRHKLAAFIQVVSRHGHQPGVYLVPGVPEAATIADAKDAVLDFVDWLASYERDGIEFPLAGQDKTNRSTSDERFQRTAEMLSGRA